ncbi:MAG: HigA family addiction module antidote protein [Acidobacteria bacterium]|nr:HigA family addiction module antidote protein [Acidobacteriota bacterium]
MTPRLSTTAKRPRTRTSTELPPVHPGEILFEDLMRPLNISTRRLARDLRVPVTRIGDIVHGRRGISADTALRLGRYFKTSPEFWQNLQSIYELNVARRAAGSLIERDVQPLDAA